MTKYILNKYLNSSSRISTVVDIDINLESNIISHPEAFLRGSYVNPRLGQSYWKKLPLNQKDRLLKVNGTTAVEGQFVL